MSPVLLLTSAGPHATATSMHNHHHTPPQPSCACDARCRWLFDTFVLQAGPRRLAGAFGSFTDSTKKAIGEARFNHHSSNGAMNFMMINSPGGPRKTDDSDEPLKEVCAGGLTGCAEGGHVDDDTSPAAWFCSSMLGELPARDPVAWKRAIW